MHTPAPLTAFRLILSLCSLLLLASCAAPPTYLADDDVIAVGSRIEFWVKHDDRGWVRSNIHIAYLPRVMTGAEARHWAEGVGRRDAGIRWTHYYLSVTTVVPVRKHYRTAIYTAPPLVRRSTK